MMEFLVSNSPWFWLIVLIVCIIIEAPTMALTTVWGAIAALPMIFIAKTGLAFKWQFLIFAIITVALIIFTRPFALKKLKMGKSKTNVNMMEGEEVQIVKTISKFQKGEAKAKNGVVWTATSENGDTLQKGSIALISAVEGNTLILKAKEEKENKSEEKGDE